MKKKNLTWLLAAEILLLLILAGVVVWLTGRGALLQKPDPTDPPVTTTGATTAATTETTAETTTVPETEPATEATTVPEPVPEHYWLSFAGDCTLGTMYQYYAAASCFPGVVGDNYAYPFAGVQEWFASDDLTLVNLEGPLTNEGTPADKAFCFRGDPAYVNILTEGSVEFVNLANNHSEDFGPVGYENTQKALDGAGVSYAGNGETIIHETDRGLKVGILCVAFYIDHEEMAQKIVSLKDRGAQVVIVSFHWGEQGYYHPTYDQSWYAYAAIDAGANIVYGHHPHVLQPIEEYNGGIIYYSLGNFAFGGNDCPADFDTAVIQQEIIVDVDGTVSLGQTNTVPCSISPEDDYNRFQPTPAEEGSVRYDRVMEKLSGTYYGPNVVPSYETEEPTGETVAESTAEATEATEATETTDAAE